MTSLLEDIKKYYENEKYPPDGDDLDVDYTNGKWIEKGTKTERVSLEVIDDTPRWGDVIQAVYRRGDEYVAVEDVKPATEMQDWGDYGKPTIYEVKPVVVTITKYKKV